MVILHSHQGKNMETSEVFLPDGQFLKKAFSKAPALQTDIGFEAGFLNNKITAEFAYYFNDIDGLVLNDPQSPSKGVAFTNTLPTTASTLAGGTVPVNIGRMVNKGFEFTLNAKIVNQKDFSWSSNFNIATLKNEVKSLATGNSDIFIATSGLERPSNRFTNLEFQRNPCYK